MLLTEPAPPAPFSAAEYCVRDKDGRRVDRARDEALCAALRAVNHARWIRTPHRPFPHADWSRPFCGHCFTPTGSSVRFDVERCVLEPTGKEPVVLNADGVIAGVEACAGCGHNFGLVLTEAQRAALVRGEPTREWNPAEAPGHADGARAGSHRGGARRSGGRAHPRTVHRSP